KLFGTNPRPGWVRASEVVGPEVLTEMSRLSSENSELRKRVEAMQQVDTSNFAQGDERAELTIVCKDQNTNDEIPFELPYSWDELFLLVAQSILNNPDEDYIARALNYSVESDLKSEWRKNGITPYRVLGLDSDQFNMIKTQLIGLRLIEIKFET